MSDLTKFDRGDLNTVAAALGVEGAERLANKDEVVQAILATREQGADLATALQERDAATAERDDLVRQLGERDRTIAELNEQVGGREPVVDTRDIDRIAYVDGAPGQEGVERAWWCPFCDHANTRDTVKCGGCGAERDGEQATRRTFED